MKRSPLVGNLTFTAQVFREGKLFVAYNPELDVSSCGETVPEAKENLSDAVRRFFEVRAETRHAPDYFRGGRMYPALFSFGIGFRISHRSPVGLYEKKATLREEDGRWM